MRIKLNARLASMPIEQRRPLERKLDASWDARAMAYALEAMTFLKEDEGRALFPQFHARITEERKKNYANDAAWQRLGEELDVAKKRYGETCTGAAAWLTLKHAYAGDPIEAVRTLTAARVWSNPDALPSGVDAGTQSARLARVAVAEELRRCEDEMQMVE